MNPLQTIINLEMDIRAELLFAKQRRQVYQNPRQIARLERMKREILKLRAMMELPENVDRLVLIMEKQA